MSASTLRAVDRQRRAGQCPRAQRQHVDPLIRRGQPLAVPLQHFDIGQQMMRGQHRLRLLLFGPGVRLPAALLHVPQDLCQAAHQRPGLGG
jgi:hypothetical protein